MNGLRFRYGTSGAQRISGLSESRVIDQKLNFEGSTGPARTSALNVSGANNKKQLHLIGGKEETNGDFSATFANLQNLTSGPSEIHDDLISRVKRITSASKKGRIKVRGGSNNPQSALPSVDLSGFSSTVGRGVNNFGERSSGMGIIANDSISDQGALSPEYNFRQALTKNNFAQDQQCENQLRIPISKQARQISSQIQNQSPNIKIGNQNTEQLNCTTPNEKAIVENKDLKLQELYRVSTMAVSAKASTTALNFEQSTNFSSAAEALIPQEQGNLNSTIQKKKKLLLTKRQFSFLIGNNNVENSIKKCITSKGSAAGGTASMSSDACSPAPIKISKHTKLRKLVSRRSLESAIITDVLALKKPEPSKSKLSSSSLALSPKVSPSDTPQSNKSSVLLADELNSEILMFHDISEQNRARIIDWMVQVFRAYRTLSPFTFFICVSILDKYFVQKYKCNHRLTSDQLYIIGMTAILIASKFEDVDCIRMSSLIQKAGHNRFTQQQVLDLELDILQQIGFKFHTRSNIILESEIQFKQIVGKFNNSPSQIVKDTINLGEQYLQFLCHIIVFDLSLSKLKPLFAAPALVCLTQKFMQRYMRTKLQDKRDEMAQDFLNALSAFENKQKLTKEELEVEEAIINFYSRSQNEPDGSQKNLEKSFSQFLGPQAIPISLQ